MSSVNFKPKRTAAASRGFLATAWLFVCICFYDIALWRHVKATVVSKLKSAYVKCLKMFFNFHKYSVSDMFVQLGLPSFCTVHHNAEWSFSRCIRAQGTSGFS